MPKYLKSSARTNDTESKSRQVCVACGNQEVGEYLQAPDRFHSRHMVYRLARCRLCSLVWLENRPSPEEMAAHYGPSYDTFIRKATETDSGKHWRDAVARIRRYKEGGALLDLGCGAGSFLNVLHGPSWKLYGIEVSPESASLARRRTRAEIITGDILAARFPAGSFDAVTCFHVLEHLHAPTSVMAKVWTWLKPGGILYLHVPNIESAEAHVFRSYWYPLELPRHLYHFSPASIRHLAKWLGYQEAYLATQKVSFTEYSTRYIVDSMLLKAGMRRLPLAVAPSPSFAWRVFRKGLRLTVLPLVDAVISRAGEGQIIEAVLRKVDVSNASG